MLTDTASERPRQTRISRAMKRLAKLGRNRSGVTTIEFAFILPIFIGLSMFGSELAYLASVKMQVSQLATSMADNASRLGQTDNSAVVPSISETEVDALLIGAAQQGERINIAENGRIILTSLEMHSSGQQWIHWQRCTGELDVQSQYGNETNLNGLNGPVITGVGRDGEILAPANSAVMYVEVVYQHQNLFGSMFTEAPTLRQEAAYLLRDGRNLRQNDTKGLSGATVSSGCN